ncbi:MAG: DUF1844 domain-containing protein [Planctomycetaceae bacterium]|nr:DUF1844 domain-containing protein [Planctomycetaceae bacterium]
MTAPESKIIVDEDWKSQVQAEKEALSQQATGSAAPESTAPAPSTSAPPPAESAAAATGQPIPPPTMTMLFSSLATQAMFALGLLAEKTDGEPEVHLDEARHVIDTLQLLEEKTRGNLTPDEGALLTRLLYDLRMAYVAIRDRGPAGSTS